MKRILLALALAACAGTPPEAPPPGRLDVQTASFPADWLVQRIAGDRVNRRALHPAGEDPPEWQPPPEVIAGIADADLLVVNGAGFEAWVQTATLPTERVVDTSAGLTLIQLEGKTHSHGKSGEHSHTGPDPHTWSDPDRLAAQAANLTQALASADPANAKSYQRALDTLKSELRALTTDLQTASAPLREVPLAASHPAFNYLAERCGLQVTSFDFDPETAPADLAEFTAWAAENPRPILLWEAEPTADVRAAFPEQVQHVYLDPLESPAGETYDYLAQARTNVERLAALASSRPGDPTLPTP